MKLGVLTNLLADVPFAEAAKYFASLGIQAVEIGAAVIPEKHTQIPTFFLTMKRLLMIFAMCSKRMT